MIEEYQEAVQELKRADHSIFATLKYTRTMDVLLNVVERLVKSIGLSMKACLIVAKSEGKLEEIPENSKGREILFRELFPDYSSYADIYSKLKKVIASGDYQVTEEFRKNLTIKTRIDGCPYDLNVEMVHDYYKQIREFVKEIRPLIDTLDD
ncbi:hypothetical protein COV93_08605 [Candidatus Woesearchaeota archaeon CG11_big_fil_rev_8_21_14_0_20_43_8]|nr:MAG: hypothetical protein COV93_08605 [Candidatus Woesearchaeota archaeon CG11_big_fil_rev_8_21_14_0_20_43_8]PIO04820.1 MAG: hypothetical protein COT47_07360 [Candidatus Woesearchaeota archaeon CG08_land_8_20_14_0_20_43_7]